jgi:hypothetical protein
MAFTSTDRSLCNKILTDFPGLTNPLNSSSGVITGYASSLDSQLRSMAWSGTSAINSGISTLNSTVGNAVPGKDLSDMQALKAFLDNCAYLAGNNPLGTILNAAKGIMDLVDDTLDTLAGTVPEFGAGKLAGYINQLMNGLGIPGGDMLSDIFKSADKLITCMTNLCSVYDPGYYGPYITSYTSQLQSLYTTMNIVDDPLDINYGLFDYDSLYASVGLTPGQISDMTLVVDAVDTVKSTSMSGVMDSIASVKDLLKEGSFFV